MITGRLPFEGDTPVSVAIQHINSIPLSPRELDPTIPEALEAITMKAMAPNPDDRYLSADEMLGDLEEFRKNPNINFDYNVLEFDPEEVPEEEYTQIRPAHLSGRGPSERRYEDEEDYPPQRRRDRRRYEEEDYPPQRRRRYEYEEDDYPPRRRGPVWPVFLAVAAVLLFVGVIGYFLFNTLFAGLLAPPETHEVPDLVGKVYEEIKDNTELLAGFTLIEGDTVADDAAPGTIIDQDPKGGKEVGETVTAIKVTISGGPEIVPVPDLDGMTYNNAVTLLKSMGLKVSAPKYENHETIEEGVIISYTPLKDVEVPPGTEVQIVVSKGPEDKPFRMPKLVGMTKSRALAEIDNKNLQKGNVEQEEYDDEVEEGKVISQYPLEDTEVTEGTEVNLVISKGPDPASKPPEPPVPAGSTKTVTVPLEGYVGIVTVQLFMDGGEVGKETVDATMESAVSFQVTGTGSKVLSYYINGVIGNTTIPINFDE